MRAFWIRTVCASELNAESTAAAVMAETGATFVHPYDDPRVIAGQGTAGLEILEQCPDVTAVYVQIGGGGLISGVALAIKSLRPDVRIVGVEPTGAPTLYDSLKVGRPLRPEKIETIAEWIDSPEKLKICRDMGFEMGQGRHFGVGLKKLPPPPSNTGIRARREGARESLG